MKAFLSFLSLISLTGLLSITGCASEYDQGGSDESREYSHGIYPSPQNPPPGVLRGDYWARDYPY